MSKGRVLVIDDDEWVCRLLAVAMKEAGFEITISENAADGFYRAVDEQPDCIVCDVDLPDHDGYWVAKKIRAHPTKIAMAPFVFLSGLDDREHRLEGFQVGGDAYLTKPFRIDEVVAQVDALIQMAARLKKARQTLASIPPPHAAMSGDLAQMSAGTLLTLLDLERRSGVLELKSEGRVAQIHIANGSVANTTVDGAESAALDTIRRTMMWTNGKFAFTPSAERASLPDATPINALLMEAARLEDEERAGEGDRPSSARLASWKESITRGAPRSYGAAGGPGSAPGSGPGNDGLLTPQPPPPSAPAPLPPTPLAPTVVPLGATPPPPAAAPITPTKPPPDDAPHITIEEERASTNPIVPPAPRTPGNNARPPLKNPLLPSKPFTPPATQKSGEVERVELDSLFPGPNTPASPPVAPRTELAKEPPTVAKEPPKEPAKEPPKTPSKLPPPKLPSLGTPKLPSIGNSKPSKPSLPVPRTAFGAQLRSLSPARPMRAVTPPTPPVEPAPAAPVAPAAPAAPAAPEAPTSDVDEGWSSPPRASDDQEPFSVKDPASPPKTAK